MEDVVISPEPTKKSVQIVEQFNRVYFIDPRSEFSEHERRSSFFIDVEYAAMRKREVALSREVDTEDPDREVGLESRREKGFRRRRIDDCIMSVLLEQELRGLKGQPMDPICLARLVVGYSQESSKLAFNRAIQNAAEIHAERNVSSTQNITPLSSTPPTTTTTTPTQDDFHTWYQQRRCQQQRRLVAGDLQEQYWRYGFGEAKSVRYDISEGVFMTRNEFHPPSSRLSRNEGTLSSTTTTPEFLPLHR